MTISNTIKFASRKFLTCQPKVKPTFIWGHGWGQDHRSFLPLVSLMESDGNHIVLDFPGFGETPAPVDAWGTAEYADATAENIVEDRCSPTVHWVGHSFGCRVGLQLATRHPELISSLILIAGAGLPRRRTFFERNKIWLKIRIFKILKFIFETLGRDTESLKKRFGSTDYANAGSLRPILANVIREDLTSLAKEIKCPVLLVYGEKDTETPPEIGMRLSKLIANSKLIVLPGLDHNSILVEGRHVVAQKIVRFLEDQ